MTFLRPSLALPFAAAAALFSLLASRFSEPEHAADDRTLGRCMAAAFFRTCCIFYCVAQGGWTDRIGHGNAYKFSYVSGGRVGMPLHFPDVIWLFRLPDIELPLQKHVIAPKP